jgi:hypothetical protein
MINALEFKRSPENCLERNWPVMTQSELDYYMTLKWFQKRGDHHGRSLPGLPTGPQCGLCTD